MAFNLFSGKGVDIVYDAVGGPTSIETLRCVNFGARFCIVGWTSTPFVAKGKAHCWVYVMSIRHTQEMKSKCHISHFF